MGVHARRRLLACWECFTVQGMAGCLAGKVVGEEGGQAGNDGCKAWQGMQQGRESW